MQYYNPKIETLPREQLKQLQSERLVAQVRFVYDNVECYRNRMKQKGITPDDIHGIEDLAKLPFSYKSDLRDCYPYGLFAVSMEKIVRLHASSGTTGKRIVVGYTKEDLDMWGECIARMFISIGATEKDVIQNCFGYGLFTGGFGLHNAIEKIGATVVPISAGNTALQIQTMIDFGTTGICCTPSYALYLAEEIERLGVKDQLKLRFGIFGAEPWSEGMRASIEQKLGIKAYDIYGLSEVMGPGVACECPEQNGMHIWEDNFIAEIINPETGEVLPEGATGELVFTTLTKQGFPIIRYRTRDMGSFRYETCKCGRTHLRMNKPEGRSDDMLIVRGVNVFPSQIEEVLLKFFGGKITPNYLITIDRVNNTDTFDLSVEMSEQLFADDMKGITTIEKQITAQLRSTLGLGVSVHLVNPKTIARSEGKAKRVIDNRKL